MMKGLLKKSIALLTVGILTISLTACSKGGTTIEDITSDGKLIIGTSADFPPYEFKKEIDGEVTIVGFDIAVGQAIADELGVELEIKDMDFEGLLAALSAGTIDMVISGMNPTPEREESVDFTDMYYIAEQTVLVREEDAEKYTSIDSLSGLKIAAQKGTIQEGLVTEQVEGAELVALAKIPDLVLQLKSGKVEAIAVESAVAESYAKANSDLVVGSFQFDVAEEEKGAAIAVKENSDELIEKLNEILADLIEEGKIDQFVVEANEMVEAGE